MNTLIDKIKEMVCYTENGKKCKDCASFQEDKSTDNFGSGDMCKRNIDMPFMVNPNAVCNKFSKR